METALRHYGARVARQILATGVDIGYWDLGNEVDTGVAAFNDAVPGYPQSPGGQARFNSVVAAQ